MSSSRSTETATWIDLSQPIAETGAGGGVHRPPRIEVERHALHGHDVRITSLSMGAHATTHVDAPRHFFDDGATIDQLPLSAFIGPGVVIDASGQAPAIGADFLRRARPTIESGDVVFLYTGHARRFGTPEYVEDHPWLADDAARLLVELRARMVGMDVATPDRARGRRDAGFDYPVHNILMKGGVLIVENLGAGLTEVLGERLILGIMPLAIEGSDGGPGTAFALRPSHVETPKE